MSTAIEQRIVEMQFDNKQFESGVSTTMASLGKLKQSLNLTGASKGLENVGAAAKGINLSGLVSAAETVTVRFSYMQAAIAHQFNKLVDAAFTTGKRIASALTIDPIKTGFAEYETQINAVQTILANTKSKGTTITDVNAALDQLNTYADKTIYNFTEMTRNIGTFTAAGVDLDKSVTSIKGIANLAAVSGSNSQQASTAMYQLSQALAAGKVQLMDWNSVVNAGMGGEVFQNALKRTAKNMGTDVDALIKKYGSFRESLTQGEWLTADVLTETLTQLSGAYTEADLLAQGYTKEQAAEILDLAQTAEDAATKVKTFTQLWDTLKESAQSGWTQTWEILIGDFEEAKEMLTKVSDVIGKMIGDSAEARNNLLQGWKDAGGRNDLLEGFKNAFTGIMNIVKPIREAFRNIFPPLTVDQLVNFTRGFKNLTAAFADFTAAHGDQIRTTFEGIFAVVEIGWTLIKDLAGGIRDLISHFTGLGGGILDVTASLGDWLLNLRDSVKEGDIFGRTIDAIVGFVGNVIDKIKSFGGAIKDAFQAPGVKSFMDILSGVWGLITQIGSKVGEMLAPLGDALVNVFKSGNLSDIINDGIFAGVLVGLYKFVDNLNGPLESLKDIFDGIGGEDGIVGGLKETLDSVRGCFEAYQNSLNAEVIKKIAVAIAILAASLFVISTIDSAALDQSLGAVTVMFIELMGALAVFSKMDFAAKGLTKGVAAINGLAAALLVLAVALKIMSTMSLEEMCVAMLTLIVSISTLLAAVTALSNIKGSKATKTISKLASALLVLSAAMKIMGSMSLAEMGVALLGVVVGLGALVAAVNLLPKNTGGRALGIVTLAAAMVILGAALKIMASLSMDQMCVALTGVVGGITALVVAAKAMPSDMGAKSLGMLVLATSLVILGAALKSMGSMNWSELATGLVALGGSLAMITYAMNSMSSDVALKALGMIVLAGALVILGAALKIMGSLSIGELVTGLVAIGGTLAVLAVGLTLMIAALPGAYALVTAAGALALLTPVLVVLGSMSLGSIVKALVSIAGVFTILGVAAYVLTPVIPTLLALAGAMALFGVAALAFGAGLALIGVGITSIATALSVSVNVILAGISAIILGIIGLIPNIILGLGDAILALCTVIKDCAPAIVDTIMVVLAEVCTSLATYVPVIADALFGLLIGALDVLAERMPELIGSAMNVIGAFFSGIADALSGLDTSSLLSGIVGVGLMTALAYGLSGVLAILPGAMAGVIGMGVLIAELALVLAAVGALAQIPGLSWLIGEGGDLLQQIGTAIGQFVGGIVGGIAEGATSTLPQVGSNLSSFMTNLEPFISGMQGIDASVIDSATALAGAILALTAADLISGIASFFSGGSSLADFGTELTEFGTAMKGFATEVAGIDTAAVSTATTAASELVKMAGEVPSDGLFGTDGIDDFGDNLVDFAKCMKKYADEVAGIDSGSISASVAAAKGLVEVAQQIPDDGTFGTDGIDNFGDNIVDFGKALKKYANNVAGIGTENITKSASAVRSLIGVIDSLSGLDTSGIASFKTALNDLSKVNFDGFVQAFTSSAAKLTNVGKNMFSSIISGAESMRSNFVSTIRSIVESGTTVIDGNVGKFGAAGTKSISEFLKGILAGRPNVARAFTTILASAVSTIRSYSGSFYSAGAYLVIGFANGILANRYRAVIQARAMAAAAAEAAKSELDEHSPSRVGYGIGDFFGIGFVNAIADNVKKAYNASAGMANAAESGLKGAFDKVSRIINGEVDINPTISPVLDLTNVKAGADAIGGMLGFTPSVGVLAQVGAINSMMNQRSQNGNSDDIVSAINKLQKVLANSGNTTNIINGVTYDNGSSLNEAVRVIAQAALLEGRV